MSENKGSFIIRLFRFLNLLLVFISLLALTFPYIKPSSFFPIIYLGISFPILIALNVLFLLFWLIKRKWYWIFSLLYLVISWDNISTFVGHPFHATPNVEKGKVIKIMTFNAKGGGRRTPFLNFIKKENPDIVCFQELTGLKSKINPLAKIYPYLSRNYTRIIYSRFPIDDAKNIPIEKKRGSNGGDRVNIALDDQTTIRLYNLHLRSNKITTKVNKLSNKSNIKKLDERGTWIQAKTILGAVKRSALVRSEQAEKIQNDMKDSPHPIIVCGDFNDTPQSYTYATISKGLDDAFVKGGKGLGFTYKGKLPFLKIDYTLVSPEIKVISSEVISCDISDHNPLVTTLFIPAKK